MENVDFELALGVLETGSYGNKFNGAVDVDGLVHGSFVIDGSPESLVLHFDGFDIDDAEEMRVFINGVDLGTVAAGVNEGLAAYTLFLPANLLQTGTNAITFEKLGGVTYKWGVTNLLLEPGSAPPPPAQPVDFTLTFGVVETGSYGNKFNGAADADGKVHGAFVIDGTPENLVLRFDGFDIDDAEEMRVFVNGVNLGTVAAGVNEGLAPYTLSLSANILQTGTNTITFEKLGGATYKWGVTNLLLDPASASPPPPPPPPPPSDPVDFTLAFGVTETGSYGNNFNGATDADGKVHGAFVIDGAPENLVLRFDGFDIDDAEEMRVFVNGVNLGTVAAGVNEGLAPYTLSLSANILQTGTNTITFEKLGGVTYKWGVTNLLLDSASASPPPPPPPPPTSVDFTLTFGVTETGSYGNKFNGATDADGKVHGAFVIDGTPENLVLRFDGFDIDDAEEMQVFVNGVNLGTVPAGVNEGLAPYALSLSANILQTGTNSITFEKLGGATYKWGVTNLLLEPGSAPPPPPPINPHVIAWYDTTLWSADDPSGYGCCDPSGIAYIPGLDLLFIADSEHNERPFYSPVNLFAVRTDGTYVGAYSLRDFTDEPTGLGYNPVDGLLYISDDDQAAIFIVDPLDPTTLLGTINLAALGIGDAEDPVFDPVTGHMYFLDGSDRRLYEITVTGQLVSSFRLPSGITDAEGLAYDPQSQTFLVSSGKTNGTIFQVDKNGTLLSSTGFLNSDDNPTSGIKPQLKGLEFAPSSDPNDGDTLSLYVVDYGVDQVADGRMYELNINDIFAFV